MYAVQASMNTINLNARLTMSRTKQWQTKSRKKNKATETKSNQNGGAKVNLPTSIYTHLVTFATRNVCNPK